MIKRPNFFVMGAPKCGTTSLHGYLRQHPEIYVPRMKEIHFFGDDLPFRQGLIKKTVNSEEKYLSLFSEAREEKAIGDVGVWYLYSEKAPYQIKEFSPSSRAIVMLRNPVEAMYSFHSTLLFSNKENIQDFGKALAAEKERKRGRLIPLGLNPEEAGELFYKDIFKYSSQLERLFKVFRKEEVLVIIFDEFKKDTAKCYKRILRFLGVDEDFKLNFEIANPSKETRFKWLGRFLHRPPSFISRAAIKIFPRAFLLESLHRLRVLNSRPRSLPPMDPELKKQLQEEFKPDIERVSELLKRDLSFWYDS